MGRCTATPAGRLCSRWAVFPAAAILCAAITTLVGSGCAGRAYDAARLPANLIAPPAENVEIIDLSGLATYSVSNELIDRGDVLNVTLLTDYGNLATTTTPVRVGEDGYGDVPLIGKVPLAGLELEGAEQAIASAAVHRGVFRDPHVTVTMKRQRISRITVIGGVERPGVYELPRGNCSLLAALVAAGGLSDEAGPDVEIRRPDAYNATPDLFSPQPPRTAWDGTTDLASFNQTSPAPPGTIRVNLVSATREGKGNYLLRDGDVINVAKRAPKPVHVLGLVNSPGPYELPVNQDYHLLDVLSDAGGRRSQLADKVHIIRRLPGESEPVMIHASIGEAKLTHEANVRLAAGDVVSVEETPLTFVMDVLSSFVRVGLSSSLPLF